MGDLQSTKLTLTILPESLAICRLEKGTQVPPWAFDSTFFCISKTADELSIVCDRALVPPGVKKADNWRAFKVEGPLDFSAMGIVASLSKSLADNKIPVLVISTYDTDYLLVEDKYFAKAKEVLRSEYTLKE